MHARIRHADADGDAAPCAAIYAPFVVHSAVSFEAEPPSTAAMRERIATTASAFPWLVLERDGRVVGYAYAASHRDRAAYRWAADVAVYVEPGQHGSGAGRRLYERLLALLQRQNMCVACAGITLPNERSIALHRAFGFEHVGTYRRIGYKAGAWRDVSWWELLLRPGVREPPAEPLPPQQLAPDEQVLRDR